MIQDPELNEVLASFKEALDLILLKIDNLEQRAQITEEAVKTVEKEFITDIYEPAQKAFDEAIDAENFRQFKERYGERLGPYAEPLKSIEGDDFDLNRKAYDEFNALEDKNITADEFIDKLVPSIEAQLNKIREQLGVKEIEAKVSADGETEVKVDGKSVDGEGTVTETSVEKTSGGLPADQVEEFADEVLDSPEEIAKFERELAASLNK